MKSLKQYIKEFLIKENNKPPKDFEKGKSVVDKKGNEYNIEEPDGPGNFTVVKKGNEKEKLIKSDELTLKDDWY